MATSYLWSIALVVAMATGWVAVQSAWRRAFPEACADPDVLAGRSSCQGCRGRCRRAGTTKEDQQ